MKQLNFYKYTTLALILLNLSIIAFFVFTKPHPANMPPRGGPAGPEFKNNIVDVLQLDELQFEKFEQSAQKHNQIMDSITQQEHDLVNAYFQTLSSTKPEIPSDSILTELELIDKSKLVNTYKHFEEVKSILNKNQEQHFEKFLNEAMILLIPNNNKQGPPNNYKKGPPNKNRQRSPKRFK